MIRINDQQSVMAYSPNRSEEVPKKADVGYINEQKESGLSDKAQKLLNKLRTTYTNIDFMVAENDKGKDADQVLSQYTREYSVLFTTEEIEKMASDENIEKEYMDRVQTAINVTDNINEQYDLEGSFESQNGLSVVSKYGILVDEDGKSSLFADLNKLSESQKEYIEKHREKVRAEKKEAEKKEAKKEEEQKKEAKIEEAKEARAKDGETTLQSVQDTDEIGSETDPFDAPVEKSVRIVASDINELLEKIRNIDWDLIGSDKNNVGNNLDYSV